MTLNDLENTMVVQMRNQQLYLVITGCLMLLRDYINNKSAKSQLQTNEVDKAESRTY
jgi:hypothetical protein